MYAYDDIGVGWLEKVDAKIAGEPVGGRRYSESALGRREAREARRRAEVDDMVATVQRQVAAEAEGRGRRGAVPGQRAGRDVDERGGWFAVDDDADDDGWGDAA
jgi:hypothetical protein